MKHTTFRWVVASAAGLVILLGLALPPVPLAKARVARINGGVNHLAHPFPQSAFMLTNVAVTNLTTPVPAP